MNLYADTLYIADVHSVSNMRFPWNRLKDKSLMLSGATGLMKQYKSPSRAGEPNRCQRL